MINFAEDNQERQESRFSLVTLIEKQPLVDVYEVECYKDYNKVQYEFVLSESEYFR